jgi:hypothetical protein
MLLANQQTELQGSRKASKQAKMKYSQQESKQASKHACKQASKQSKENKTAIKSKIIKLERYLASNITFLEASNIDKQQKI